MFEFRQRKRWKKIANSKIVFAVLVVMVFLFGRASLNVYGKYQEAGKNLSRSSGELAELQERRDTLTANVARLKTPEGVEEKIREKFQVAKEGENLIVIVDSEEGEDGVQATTTKGFFESIKNFFGF